MTTVIGPAQFQARRSGSVSLASVAKISASDDCISPFPGSCGEAKGILKDGVFLPVFSESSSEASRCVAVQKLVPQVEVSGQKEGPFTQADGRCALVHCLCNALGVVDCLTVFLIIMVFWPQKHKFFWPLGPDNQEVSLVWMVPAACFTKAAQHK